MPKRNAVKVYGAGEFYHAYNRGVGRQDIFRDQSDYEYMLGLFEKYLSPGVALRSDGGELPNYAGQIDLIAYCLMPNHYHLFVYLHDKDGLQGLMRSTMTAYSMYFNHKYNRSGALFEGRFLAAQITGDSYFWQVSRYVHLNPLDIGRDYRSYPYSSVQHFIGNRSAKWVHPEWVVETAQEKQAYDKSLADQQHWHEEVHRLKHILANNPDEDRP